MSRSNRREIVNLGWVIGLVGMLLVGAGCASGELNPPTVTSDAGGGSGGTGTTGGGTATGVSTTDGATTGGSASGDGTAGTTGGSTTGGGGDAGGSGGSGPDDSGTTGGGSTTGGDVGPEPDADTGTMEDTADTAPPGCGGACQLGETCQNGQCVSACNPTCTSAQQCADLGDGPKCYSRCNEALTPDGCSRSGEFCRDIDPSDTSETLVCLPSQCSSHADCQSGTCLSFSNDYGSCIRSGPQKAGQPCDQSNQNMLCEGGAFCVSSGPNTTMGTCRNLCNPWAPRGSCRSDELCSLMDFRNGSFNILTFRQGFCNPKVDSQGTASLDECSSPQNMCNDGVRCFSGGQSNFCFKWCRPGKSDCVGTIPSRFMAGEKCDNYLFGGERRIGRCVPQCSGTRYCDGSGLQCNGGICRSTCSPGSVVQDCCGGQRPCDWTCNNGLCE